MEYQNLNELNESFMNGEKISDSIIVDGAEYHCKGLSPISPNAIMEGDFESMIAFQGEEDVLVFFYEMANNELQQIEVKSLNEAAKKKAAKKKTTKKKAAKKKTTPAKSSGIDASNIKAHLKNTMDKHKNTIDKHIGKHTQTIKDLQNQVKGAGSGHKAELEKTLAKVEKMLDGHKKEMEKHSGDFEGKMSELDKRHEELLKAHQDAIDKLGNDHIDRIGDLKGAHEELRRTHEQRISQMQKDHEEHRTKMQNDHDEHIKKMLDDHEKKSHKMRRDHGDRIYDMKRSHGEQLSNIKRGYEENQEQMVNKHHQELDKMQKTHDESKIGTEAHVEVLNLHNSPAMKAKVDTGATICSMHADQLQVDRTRGTVKFINKMLSPHVISVNVASMSSVKSADGGISYRPVILLNLRIKGKDIPSVEVNLNDREKMSHPFLIGQNALEKGKFIIDPSFMGEGQEIDFDYLQEIFTEEVEEDENGTFMLEPKIIEEN